MKEMEKDIKKDIKIEVRPLQDTDIEELSCIEAASFSMPWSAEDFRGLLTRDYCLYVVAEVNGQIAGCAGLTDSFHEGNIDNVVTAPQYRNIGVGSLLLEELLRQGAERGITAYTLEVRVSNAPAIHLYEKFGFVSEGIRPRFYEKPVEDAMIMWRR